MPVSPESAQNLSFHSMIEGILAGARIERLSSFTTAREWVSAIYHDY